ncbi:DinB family protein [Bacillus sp. JJ664]
MYVESVIHQITYSVDSVIQIIDCLSEEDLHYRPVENKKSIGELIQHLCELMAADMLISNGATKIEMETFYESVKCHSIVELKALLLRGREQLINTYRLYNEEDLMQKKSSYWGVEYTRFEWLLEILVHFTHHRAQLHTLVVLKNSDMQVSLFE